MRTRAKKKHVASDRTRCENVPRHILSYEKPLYAEIKMCYTGLTSCLGWKCYSLLGYCRKEYKT